MENSELGSLDAIEERARARLAPEIHAYFAGAAGAGTTLAANLAALAGAVLRPRVLTGVGEPDLATVVLGERLEIPMAIAPMALQGLAHAEGERATARAARSCGTRFTAATMASESIEAIARAAPGAVWQQVYLLRDRELTRALVARAAAAGARALVLTVDAPISATRRRSGVGTFAPPAGLRLGNLDPLLAEAPQAGHHETSRSAGRPISVRFAELIDPSVRWQQVDWLASLVAVPLVVKGILTAEDARLARDHGASAVVVSNHGGRVLDGAVATLDALPEIVAAVGSDVEVWVDGGFRSGTDVVKGLALGARLVLVGRPVLWGLAAAGEEGVRQVLALLRDELRLALALLGARSPAELTASHVRVT